MAVVMLPVAYKRLSPSQPQLKAMPNPPQLQGHRGEPSVTPQIHKQQQLYKHIHIILLNIIYRVTEQGHRTWRINNSK